MTDIVERLRDYIYDTNDVRIRMDAADEIERLRWSVHSCGPTCSRAGCVNRRLMEQKEKDEELMRMALAELEHSAPIDWIAIVDALRDRLTP